MQYRFFISRQSEPIADTQNIFLNARRVYELDGELDQTSVSHILALFCPYLDDQLSMQPAKGCVRTVYRKDGRGDRDVEELTAIVAAVKPKADVKIRCGIELTFRVSAFEEEITCFMNENLDPLIYDVDRESVHVPNAWESMLLGGFCDADFKKLDEIKKELGIKMEIDDLMCVQNYFISESRDPSYAEIRIIDCFFSESFRHTTFETILDGVLSDDIPVRAAWDRYCEIKGDATPSLSDITIAAAREINDPGVVKATKKLSGVKIETADENDSYLLLVKNESHNRSTTADPYNGAQGAVSGAVKDMLCAFGYVYDSYRVVGRGVTESAKRNSQISASGYSENASVIGVPCTKCYEIHDEIYNDKQLEVCSVLAVSDGASADKVLLKEPLPDDKIYIIGSRTGIDGRVCHTPRVGKKGEYIAVSHGGELAALQRLFARKAFADIAVAVNDIGSGGIVCALGEIVSGADVRCADIKLKYSDMSLTDAVLSESAERMIVCVRTENTERLESLCKAEGLECTCIAAVNDCERFVLLDENGNRFASLTHEFLIYGGAEKHLSAYVSEPEPIPESDAYARAVAPLEGVSPIKKLVGKGVKYDYDSAYRASASYVRESVSELSHSYDRAAGGNTAMLESVFGSEISLRALRHAGRPLIAKNGRPLYSALACGSFPKISGNDPYKGGYLSVADAVLKLIAAGHGKQNIYLALQEYFPEHKNSSLRLGTSVASMLGVFEAQMELGIPSIGGRISIGGGNEKNASNATVTAFAFCICDETENIGSSFTKKGNRVVMLTSDLNKSTGLPSGEGLNELADTIAFLKLSGKIRSAAAVNARNACSVVMEMSRGNRTGMVLERGVDLKKLFEITYGAVLCELEPDAELPKGAVPIGVVADDYRLTDENGYFEIIEAFRVKERRIPRGKAEKQYLYLKQNVGSDYGKVRTVDGTRPKVLMPLTKFTVAQSDIRAAFEKCGADVRLIRINALGVNELVKLIKKSDIVWLGDENGPSGALCSALADKRVTYELSELRARGGLIFGWGSAFDAMVGSGLLEIDPSKIRFEWADGRMVCEAVKTRAVSTVSPFMYNCIPDEIYRAYISGKGLKLKCSVDYLDLLARDGRIAHQLLDNNNATSCDGFVSAITSADGKVFAQIDRPMVGDGYLPIVENAVGYFSSYSNI